jgi:integrase/recombinase XerD
MAESSPLRRRMIEDMTVRNLSPATQRSYIHAVAKFSRYFGHSPDRLGLEEVRAFQVRLVAQGISWPALNQTVCALRFFYGSRWASIRSRNGSLMLESRISCPWC